MLIRGSVGQPGDWGSIIPVWGSGRSAIDHFQMAITGEVQPIPH